ncbi:unnamed protein product, partial [Protopolystoma xenopodis]
MMCYTYFEELERIRDPDEEDASDEDTEENEISVSRRFRGRQSNQSASRTASSTGTSSPSISSPTSTSNKRQMAPKLSSSPLSGHNQSLPRHQKPVQSQAMTVAERKRQLSASAASGSSKVLPDKQDSPVSST